MHKTGQMLCQDCLMLQRCHNVWMHFIISAGAVNVIKQSFWRKLKLIRNMQRKRRQEAITAGIMWQHDGDQPCSNVRIGDMSHAPHSFMIWILNLGNQLHGILSNLEMFLNTAETMHSDDTYMHRQSWQFLQYLMWVKWSLSSLNYDPYVAQIFCWVQYFFYVQKGLGLRVRTTFENLDTVVKYYLAFFFPHLNCTNFRKFYFSYQIEKTKNEEEN